MAPEQFEQAKRKYIHSVVVSMRDLGAVIEIDEIEKFIDAGVSDLNALLDKLMPTEDEIIEAALRQTTHKSLLPAHRGLMKDYFIIGAKWLRSRLTSSEKPNNSEQQMWRDIQENDKV